MRCNKNIYLLMILLFSCSSGMAQLMTSFSFSAMGGGDAKGSMGISSPIMLDGKTNCLSVSNGVSVLNIASNGNDIFTGVCKETKPIVPTQDVVALSLSVYPNPTKGMSLLKCNGTFDANLFCMVRVVGMDGKMIMNQTVLMTTVQAGFMIDLGAHASGTYTVIVDLQNKRYNFRLIRL